MIPAVAPFRIAGKSGDAPDSGAPTTVRTG